MRLSPENNMSNLKEMRKFEANMVLASEDLNVIAANIGYIFNLLYPVGSIYFTVSDEDPNKILVGEWERWGQGRVPMGVGLIKENNAGEKYGKVSAGSFGISQVEYMGGSKDVPVVSHTHKTVPKGGAHSHSILLYSTEGTSKNAYAPNVQDSNGGTQGKSIWIKDKEQDCLNRHDHDIAAPEKTESGDNKNFQPFITCYMWKRSN